LLDRFRSRVGGTTSGELGELLVLGGRCTLDGVGGLGRFRFEYEKLTGKPLEGLPSSDRVGWGLSDRPGELLKAA
jgi:hypothetical protein